MRPSVLLLLVAGALPLASSAARAWAAPFAYVPNFGSNNVTVVDTATNGVIATVPVGTGPTGVALDPAATRAYVVTGGTLANTLSVIDTATNAVTATLALAGKGLGVAVNPSATRAYVAVQGPDVVSVVDTATNAIVATVAVGSAPVGVVVNPGGTRAYVANSGSSSVSVVDTATNTPVATVHVGVGPRGAAVTPSGARVYVANGGIGGNSVSVIDTATNAVVATVPVGTFPFGVAMHPAGTRVYVANNDASSNSVSVIDTATNAVVATVAVGSKPLGVTVSPDGTRVYVANDGSGTGKNTLSIIDTATNTVTGSVAVGTQPYAIGTFIGPICPAGCDDGNPCTGDACNVVSGCSHTPNTGPCPGDGLFCDGVETCSGGACVSPGTPCPGPDGDGDCAESCDEAADACTAPDPIGSPCTDGTCDGLGTCVVTTTSTTTLETTSTTSTSTSSSSTTSSTSSTSTSVTSTTETTTTSSSTTTTLPPCAPTPVTTCQPAATRRAAFQLRCSDDARRTQLTWRWTAGEAVTTTDLGNPLDDTAYVLCVYDGSGLRLQARAPAGGLCGSRPCWTARGAGYRYGDRDLTPDGLWKLQVKAGDAMRAKILVKGKGAHLGNPAPPLLAPVTVQLVRGDGAACWEATFTTPTMNDQGRFNARCD